MSLDHAEKSEKQLANFVENYRRCGQTSSEAYRVLLRAYELKRGKGLDLEKTLDCVIAAAKMHRFVSYKQIAEASNVPMAKAFLLLTNHLRELCNYGRSKGLPLLSAIVVTVDGVETGFMNTTAKHGFIKAARAMGFEVDDEDAFVSAQQAEIFKHFGAGDTA